VVEKADVSTQWARRRSAAIRVMMGRNCTPTI